MGLFDTYSDEARCRRETAADLQGPCRWSTGPFLVVNADIDRH